MFWLQRTTVEWTGVGCSPRTSITSCVCSERRSTSWRPASRTHTDSSSTSLPSRWVRLPVHSHWVCVKQQGGFRAFSLVGCVKVSVCTCHVKTERITFCSSFADCHTEKLLVTAGFLAPAAGPNRGWSLPGKDSSGPAKHGHPNRGCSGCRVWSHGNSPQRPRCQRHCLRECLNRLLFQNNQRGSLSFLLGQECNFQRFRFLALASLFWRKCFASRCKCVRLPPKFVCSLWPGGKWLFDI